MKFVPDRPFADPDVAIRKLVEIASTIEPVQDGRIYVELLACTPCVCFETQTGKHLLGLSLTAFVQGFG